MATEIVSLSDFILALEYLREREQTVLTELSCAAESRGFLFLSFDMTARLFMQIASLIPAPVLKISADTEELRILLASRDGEDIPERVSLKIARTAFLAGFNIEPCGSGIALTASISRDRELAVYALSSVTLVERFKKYFKK